MVATYRNGTQQRRYVVRYDASKGRAKRQQTHIASEFDDTVAKALLTGSKTRGGIIVPNTSPKHLTISERGGARLHRIPQRYDPLVKAAVAAGGLLAFLGGCTLPNASSTPMPDFYTQETDPAKKADMLYNDAKTLYVQGKTAGVRDRLLVAHSLYTKLNNEKGAKDSKEIISLVEFGQMPGQLTAPKKAELDKIISDYRGNQPQDQTADKPETSEPEVTQKSDPQEPPEPEKPEEPEKSTLEVTAYEFFQQASDIYKTNPESEESADLFLRAHHLYKKLAAQEEDEFVKSVYSAQAQESREGYVSAKFGKTLDEMGDEEKQEVDKGIVHYSSNQALVLPDDPEFLTTIRALSKHSLQRREGATRIRTGLVDVFGHGYIRNDREATSDDTRREHGGGTSATLKLFGSEFTGTLSQGTRRRKSNDFDRTIDPNFDITTDTDTLEEIENRYRAAKIRLQFGEYVPHVTLWDSTDDVSVGTETLLDVVNLNDPAGSYQQMLLNSTGFEIESRGAQAGLEYRAGDNATVFGLYDIKEIKLPGDSKFRVHRLDFGTHLTLPGLDGLALSGAVGTRMTEDSEAHSKFDNPHGYFNIAKELGNGVTAFGTFYRLDSPAFGGGLVFGTGDATNLLMEYSNKRAWEAMDLLKEYGPEERKVYVDMLQHDFIRGLAADDSMRLLLFGGAQRYEVGGEEEWGGMAQAALVIPATKDFTFAVDALYNKVGLEEILQGGVQFQPADSVTVRFGGGVHKLSGRKDEMSDMYTVSVRIGF